MSLFSLKWSRLNSIFLSFYVITLTGSSDASVGDPGLGKSQLLQAASSVAPRGLYVCGNTTTTAGLTVAVVKDALSGDWVFEAGTHFLKAS